MKTKFTYFFKEVFDCSLSIITKLFMLILFVSFSFAAYAVDETIPDISSLDSLVASESLQQQAAEVSVSTEDRKPPGNITLDFKDADIRSVLKIISLKSGVNIVASPDVTGTISIYLDNTPWEKALEVILSTYGFGYEKKANIISVAPLDKLTEQKRMEQELAQVQPTIMKVFRLHYIDALDAKKALESVISPRGKITVLEVTGKAGWEFGGEILGKRAVAERERISLTKVLLVTDIPPIIDQIKEVLEEIDIKPKQIMIEVKILEVSRDFLEDIGFEYSTQTVGADDITIDGATGDEFGAGMQSLSSGIVPSIFGSPTTGLTPETAGMKLILKKLFGSKFEVILRALEEDVNSNLLSAPRIMTLNNQEATILIGEKYPILRSTASESTTSVEVSLDYYQDIGIQLNVIPQISGEDKITMIIHPSITSRSGTLSVEASIAQYPIIATREAETQVLMNDGETIVIGGLIKDYVRTSVIGVPFLSKLPFLGRFFRRNTEDLEKMELLIFITARIVDESGLTASEVNFLEKQVSKR